MHSLALFFSLLVPTVQGLPSLESIHRLQPRQVAIQADSPLDHKWITNVAALGESYAAGQGSGHEIKGSDNIELNTDCNQFSWSYPILLNARGMLGDNGARKIQQLSCSGAKAEDVLNKQIPKLKPSQLVTLSIGGNDAHLASILNYCIYQWSFTLTWSCDKELAAAKTDIESQSFFDNLDNILKKTKEKLVDKNSRIIWTGYERFFDISTKECDSVTWGFGFKYGFREFLTQDRRKSMNDLVDLVNYKISSICGQYPECIFVDSNQDIDNLGGHFCEPGVDETYSGGGKSRNREETWFYEWDTDKDNDSDDEKKVDQPQKRQTVEWDNSTFEGAVIGYISQGLADGNLDPSLNFVVPTAKDQLSAQSSSWYRVFHRTKYANSVIAMNVLRAIDKFQGEIMNEPVPTLEMPAACHSGPDEATMAQGAKPAPTAQYSPTGNQGEGQQDKCHIHVWEHWNCADEWGASIQIWDAAGKEFLAPTDVRSIGDTGKWKSKLENEMGLTGNKDKITFQLGDHTWTSDETDKNGDYWCSPGGWDPREGPNGLGDVCQDSIKQMDCYFKCPYNGGKASDES